MQQQVYDFHRKFNVSVTDTPTLPDADLAEFRMRLINEEVKELHDALFIDFNLVDAIDAMADIEYVLLGLANAMGVDLEPHFEIVHRANMLKVGGGMREDGKILKPDGWIPPDHQRLIDEGLSDLATSAL